MRGGKPFPLGATFDGKGTNFAVFAEHATAVTLCLLSGGGDEQRVSLIDRSSFVWHGYVPKVRPGQRYGYRVDGPFDPKAGHRYNPEKLLVDPYARSLAGSVDLAARLASSTVDARGAETRDLFDTRMSVPHGVVPSHEPFDWGGDRSPEIPWHKTIVYELHVKGFTKRSPGVPAALRGTYAGLATPSAIEHLLYLGVTTVELLPVQEALTEPTVAARGFTNYWGYSTLAYFAPDRRFAADPTDATGEFRRMVKALHAAGIEVVLDVVYNHSCEGGVDGPTLNLRGFDNAVYYRVKTGDFSRYEDFTGCGNTLNLQSPETLKLVTDSLRYWANEMHVDGFRFDLAPTLARADGGAFSSSSFFDVIHQDPVLSRLKLIAEPWDLGAGGYQAGNFPILWAEWNGRYRDAVRRFWRGDKNVVSELATRFAGSSDLYEDDGRRPNASVNFVTAHDGFTLRDLVSYERKHNEANGEGNRDGTDDNLSSNAGVEGETDNPDVLARRRARQRALLTTLLLSQGVPMVLMGDELSRTQHGNNNAYCQDGELSWVDWDLPTSAEEMLAFVREVIAVRKRHPALMRQKYLRGERIGASLFPDVTWFRRDGVPMASKDWSSPEGGTLALLLDGEAMDERDADGLPVTDDLLCIFLNAEERLVRFQLPKGVSSLAWEILLDSSASAPRPLLARSAGALFVDVSAVSVVLLRAHHGSIFSAG